MSRVFQCFRSADKKAIEPTPKFYQFPSRAGAPRVANRNLAQRTERELSAAWRSPADAIRMEKAADDLARKIAGPDMHKVVKDLQKFAKKMGGSARKASDELMKMDQDALRRQLLTSSIAVSTAVAPFAALADEDETKIEEAEVTNFPAFFAILLGTFLPVIFLITLYVKSVGDGTGSQYRLPYSKGGRGKAEWGKGSRAGTARMSATDEGDLVEQTRRKVLSALMAAPLLAAPLAANALQVDYDEFTANPSIRFQGVETITEENQIETFSRRGIQEVKVAGGGILAFLAVFYFYAQWADYQDDEADFFDTYDSRCNEENAAEGPKRR